MQRGLEVKFDVYGRFQVDVVREDERWVVYKVADGKRTKLGIVIPSSFDAAEIGQYLDDVFHEAARPGETVRRTE